MNITRALIVGVNWTKQTYFDNILIKYEIIGSILRMNVPWWGLVVVDEFLQYSLLLVYSY